MKENDPTKDGVKKVSISEFIEENYRLISTLAFFTALTAFAGNLPLKPLGHFLSFLAWVASVLIWCELAGKIPPRKQWSGPLFLFGTILGWIGMVIQAYCLIEFASVWGILFYPIFFLLSTYILIVVFTVLIRVSPTYQRVALPIYKRSKTFFWLIHVLLFILVWVFLLFTTPQLNRLLINIHQRMEGTNSSLEKIGQQVQTNQNKNQPIRAVVVLTNILPHPSPFPPSLQRAAATNTAREKHSPSP